MAGHNWNSRSGKRTPLVRPETKELARRAQEMERQGVPRKEIAARLGKSLGRIREYLT